jgi:hypothetical protein
VTRALLACAAVACWVGPVAAASVAAPAAPSPKSIVAEAKREWLHDLLASGRHGDRDARFPSPSRDVLLQRLQRAQALYRFRIVRLTMLRPFQLAPVIVIRSDARRAIARATPRIVELFDPHTRPTGANPSGYAYEGYFLVAVDARGVPYLATFNHWRAPHVGGGEWAASPDLYPFPHG